MLGSTASRKNFKSVESFIDEPDSRAQCAALEENVKEFGLTYFGMTDKRQGQSWSFFVGYPFISCPRNCPHHRARTGFHSTSVLSIKNSC